MRNIVFSLVAVGTWLFTGCEAKKQAEKQVEETSRKETMALEPALPGSGAPPTTAGNPKFNFDRLQGKWQHTEDTTNFLVFANNHRKEIAAGMSDWDDEEFIIADKCQNETDKVSQIAAEKDKYISVLSSDMCWYIVALDSSTLTLSYVGRGNTLTYKKVNQ